MKTTDLTVLGHGSFVRGNVRGDGDVEIEGRVEGEIEVAGAVTVGADGIVKASIRASRIVVRGAVLGDLVATESLRLEKGARVVGDLRAPSIGIAEGGLVRGNVETGEASSAPAARAAQKPAQRPAVQARPAPAQAPARIAAPVAKAAPTPAPKPAVERAVAPPPVVPVLRKGAKGAVKKKAR